MNQQKTTLNNILVKSAIAGLDLQKEDGSFPPGHNGPWNDLDTPVRVTAHWAILFLKMYKLTKNPKFKNAARKAGEYLISKKCRPHNFSFFCRNNKDKNKCNGLIGQAWAIEALVELNKTLKEKKYLSIAEDVVLKHPFNNKLCLWYNLEIDGKKLNINKTLNQQIWFGVMAYKLSEITNNKIIKFRSIKFFNNLYKHVRFNGRYITHLIHPLSNIFYRKEAKGYLSFVLMGLAEINPLLLDKKILRYIKKSVGFLNKEIYHHNYRFCWSYNPCGFEVPYVINIFKLKSSITSDRWLSKQLKRHFNFKSNLMNKNTSDPNTLAARIYEATRLPNIKLEF